MKEEQFEMQMPVMMEKEKHEMKR